MNNKLEILSIDYDEVIQSRYVTAQSDYEFALNYLVPLIDRLDIQRTIQDSKFYTRLEKDLIKGCIMPPITLAFVDTDAVQINRREELFTYFLENIKEGFILDGIQRLNTLQRTYKRVQSELDISRAIFLNIVICSSMDNLLYRMITLNNGQKPMSARHQIEILTANIFEFEDSIHPIITEKDAKRLKIKVAFNKADFIKGYLAFLANSTNIENQKIIEEKLDELIADKILDSNITDDGLEFSDVVNLISILSSNEHNYKWLKSANNLIGFCVGIRNSYDYLKNIHPKEFEESIKIFEQAFSSFNFSKIKIGRIRRVLSNYFIKNFSDIKDKEVLELVDELSQVD